MTRQLIAVLGLAFVCLARAGAAQQLPDWTRRQPLPAPNGPYPVGTLTLHVEDWNRPTSHHIRSRQLAVQVWYPARRGQGPRAPYLGERGLLDSMIVRKYLDLGADELQPWDSVKLAARLKAIPAAPPAGKQGWPVIVFSHGMGVARANYASVVQELASHGYVVLAIDHPMGGFSIAPNGQLLAPGVDSVPYPYPRVFAPLLRDWAMDAAFVVRTATASLGPSSAHGLRVPLDTTRVGMLGHSLGGAAALQACHSEALFLACADMDGDTFGDVDSAGVGKPFLVLLSEPNHTSEPTDSAGRADRERLNQMGKERDSSWTATVAKQPGVPAYVVKLKGTGHMSFSDAPFLFPSEMANTGSTMDRVKAYRLIAADVLEFFDHYLMDRKLKTLKPGMSALPATRK